MLEHAVTAPRAWLSRLVLIIGGVALAVATSLLASSSIGFWSILLLPAAVGLFLVLLSLELATYLITFFVFSGIAWGLELPGGFLLVTLVFISAWVLHQFLEAEPMIYFDSSLPVILLLLLFLVTSLFDAPYPELGFAVLLDFGKILLFYLIFVTAISDERMFRQVFWVAIASVVVSALYGFYQMYQLLQQGTLLPAIVRLRGLTYNPNALALNLVLVVSFFAYLFFLSRDRRVKLLSLGLAVFGVAAISATVSRAGYIALGVLFLLLAWEFRARRWPVLVVAVLLVLVLLFLPDEYFARLALLLDPMQDASLRWRVRLYLGAVELIQQYPINGLGLGQFVTVSVNYINKPLDTHNTYLQLWAECGPGALLSFLGLFGLAFWRFQHATQYYRERDDVHMQAVCQSLKASVLLIAISAIFGSFQTFYVLWCLFAFGAVAERVVRQGVAARPL